MSAAWAAWAAWAAPAAKAPARALAGTPARTGSAGRASRAVRPERRGLPARPVSPTFTSSTSSPPHRAQESDSAMSGIFKAYDVRGIYPSEINAEVARQIGLAFQHVLDAGDRAHGNTVVVSRDMRGSSPVLASALIDGITEAGFDVLDIGLASTPMNYFAIGHTGAAGGVQVTASHNPAQYNGFKFSRHGARPVSGDHGIELMESKIAAGDLPAAARPGVVRHGEVTADYRKHVLGFLEPAPAGRRRLKVAIDAASGMVTIDRPILDAMGIEILPLYFELDGSFPNHEPNPLKEENLRDLSRAVRDGEADFGAAFDGDADRVGFVDERGEPIPND